jgi:hypothetical protein
MKRLLKLTVAVGLVAALLIPAGMALAVVPTVYVDIKPASCPNPLNVCRKGVMSVAILGTDEFDVTNIDPATVRLNLAFMELDGGDNVVDGVSPLRWAYEDVATPYLADEYRCHDLGADGYLDLVLKFNTREVVQVLELSAQDDGAQVLLEITGNLFECESIRGFDRIDIINKMINGEG